ncbi:MAG: lysophospholipid acyltransferase family protein, partial [Planctomycetota bacterium]
MEKPRKNLSVSHFAPGGVRGWLVRAIAPAADRLMGLAKLRKFYASHLAQIHDRDEFASTILSALEVDVNGTENFEARVPQQGPLIVVSNHPYGAMEGVILGCYLGRVRPDIKILATRGLSMVQELGEYFIYTQPLLPNDPRNRASIRQCNRHLKDGGILGIFPAGRVSFYQPEKGRVTDGDWNRLPITLAERNDTAVLPVHFSGGTSQLFQMLGRIYYRFRLLMLVREMFHLEKKSVTVSVGTPISQDLMSGLDSDQKNDFLRLQVYLKDPEFDPPWPEATDDVVEEKPLGPEPDQSLIRREIERLPENQKVADFKQFSTYFGYHEQMPAVVQEISRLRELTFRTMDEGSGEPYDTDKFDATYTHLFVCDNENESEIIAAYRMGQTDRLQEHAGIEGIYLSQMFNFGPQFINQTEPCLEMGRSFIVPKHQRSFYGLSLLWKGIGGFL